MTKSRRDRAIEKIKRLEKELETMRLTPRGSNIREKEICKLQMLYKIRIEDIHPPKKMFKIVDGVVKWNW